MASSSRRWTGRTQEDRRAERRELLIVSATRLYGSLGFRNTGVRAVCRDAGLTERYFYESFANSEALLLAAFDRVVSALRDQIMRADASDEPRDDRVRRLLRAYFGALAANPTAARVFLVEIVGVDAEIDRAFEASLFALSEPFVTVFDPEHRGPLSTDLLLRRGVSGGLLHIALAWGAEGYARPIEQVIETALVLCRLAGLADDTDQS
ncbi:TetR/AcrR family transcriptional regulator [Sphingomonas mollis]|uniref:TetR/AcrR family transcriptional regulator n=1 Tax=Sphingomonas mollis TaxID=2795726 RepID=A0ABS0XVG5_9SPHN|nr:TetR/AcrR family transcriptional regulator [Sphingomonas sp. BT553]MBJ6123738.1 TetR/AcrR family transcriptional regulator [Sphingomonas sp. BT553]